VVFFVSSVLVTVPSEPWVTVFSLDLTVPSLVTLVDFSCDTSRAHPTSKNDSAKADIALEITDIGFFICVYPFFSSTCFAYLPGLIFPVGEARSDEDKICDERASTMGRNTRRTAVGPI
jgi:hypothetical protein